jgi:exodeoxyribonuclease VII large subunit
MESRAITVSKLNEYVRRSLAADPFLQNIRLVGEISNFKWHSSGHMYFSLKDEESRVDCALFRQYTTGISFRPADGMRVILTGSAGLYTVTGNYQFYATSMQKDGVGDLYEAFLKLKEQLTVEGLFDPARKRPLPLLPSCVGVITSGTGAVLHDIQTVVKRRFSSVQLLLRPTLVQGPQAADDLVLALEEIQAQKDVDVVIIGRGGGSLEDLWPFNEEKLVRAVANCSIPIICAVGHETDVTLCDFAADVRAATPSQAAELAVPDQSDLKHKIQSLASSLRTSALSVCSNYRLRVNQHTLNLNKRHPQIKLKQLSDRLYLNQTKLSSACSQHLMLLWAALEKKRTHLQALGPEETMKRGYVIALDQQNHVIKRAGEAPKTFNLRFIDANMSVQQLNEVR